ncbi:MBL fold metallo-hydrolase [Brevibacillus dissolubilis]|uniref:MBL fold metallo-hydrolase n=1 Tax=Brevibacillus dissolubilis TaxID=1844116 RepID=UPI0011172A59|nr:MBL fold metallo-hydrolase [Brevibacillus dissolubilis]
MIATIGIKMLEITATHWNGTNTIHPTLIWDENEAVLIDAGYPGQLPLIREAMEQAGVPFEKLTHLIITHQDLDHIGSMPNIIIEASQPIQVLANELEKPYIQGEKRLIKLTDQAIASLDSLPDEWREGVRRLFMNPPRADVDRVVTDGEQLPFGGGLTIINTPGHTPGHISLYYHASKTLIAADAMNVVDGKLTGPAPQYTYDLVQARASLKKLAAYDIETVICYHGGMYTGDANKRIAELADEE